MVGELIVWRAENGPWPWCLPNSDQGFQVSPGRLSIGRLSLYRVATKMVDNMLQPSGPRLPVKDVKRCAFRDASAGVVA
jgi:hypothetical protein